MNKMYKQVSFEFTFQLLGFRAIPASLMAMTVRRERNADNLLPSDLVIMTLPAAFG